ncbi:hypothetical protein RoseRS_2327 [Roseiflexus sp. RS-1]|nr:hypothetical protein RoseRS_2327 [Roseiflexus sp. RS-1]
MRSAMSLQILPPLTTACQSGAFRIDRRPGQRRSIVALTEPPLTDLVQTLPPELQQRVRLYIAALLREYALPSSQPLRQDWAGALRDLRDQTTALELQHQATAWMIAGAMHHANDHVSD